jgi:predicted ATPase/class 3 adenylate cyclase
MGERQLPAGTVTFLFTDIEGSTRLLHEHGAVYVDLLAEHRRVLRDAFAAHGGVEVDTQGDAFFVAFGSAAEAVAAADDARRGLGSGPIRVRIGIHTGEPLVTDEGYVGLDVHRAARIAGAAHGGQIVVSETTRNLVGGGAALRDLGEHRLKDLIEAERLYQLGDGEFPPLRTVDATNLPVAASALVGREREVAELVELLANGMRLVTVTGPGGTGKTRLALQVAAELAGTVRDGVFWLPLASLTEPGLVPSEVAQVVGARGDLGGFLAGKELLLVLDNFEHLLDAAPAVAVLLGASHGVRVLVTSRSPLRISGEREYRLDPLPVDDAAALFVERARAVGRQVSADATVAAICRRLDGLPLAIELAAARTKLLAPERLLERLQSALPLLTGGARDAPERQRTLRATISWSHDLLDPAARALFSSLSVFAGAFPIEGAEQVCGADLDGLAALVDSSLLKPIGDDRFLMLETVREFAHETIAASETEATLRSEHARFFSCLAEQAYEHRVDAEAVWSARLALDQDDLRAALDWLDTHDPARALELAGALGWFWLSHGLVEEGRSRLTGALAASPGDGGVRARALTAAGSLLARSGRVDEGRVALADAIAVWRELGDEREVAATLEALGWLLVYDAGDDDAALDAFEQSVAVSRELRDTNGEARALAGVCQVLVALGEVDRAEPLSRDLLKLAHGEPRSEHFAYHFLADCALIRGNAEEALRRYSDSLRAALPLGDPLETSFEVEGVAMSLAALGDPRRALQLAAAAEAVRDSLGLSFHVRFWDALVERHIASARAQLADGDEMWAEGRATAFDDAVALALDAAD